MQDQTKLPTLALTLGLVLLISISLVKGGALKWASLAWVSLSGLSLCILLLFKAINTNSARQTLPLEHAKRAPVTVYLFILFQLWALFQYFVTSQDQSASLDQWLIGVGMFCLGGIWVIASKHPKALLCLYWTIIASALIQSIYGLWVFISQTNFLLWMPKLYYLDRPTGFFVNANHFAAYLVLSITLCLSRLMALPRTTIQSHFLVRAFDQLYNPSNAILALLLITLIASKSIGAMAALTVVIALLGAQAFWNSKHRHPLMLACLGLLLVIAAILLTLDYSSVERELSGLSHTFNRRIELSKAAFTMLQSNWLLGVGGGAFYSQFSPFRTLEIGNTYYNYAHNDLLQFWIEYGLVGVTLLALFIYAALRDNARVLSHTKTGLRATFAYASIYCTIAVLVHSLVDFPLHIPGFSVCYLLLISINSLSVTDNTLSRHADLKQ